MLSRALILLLLLSHTLAQTTDNTIKSDSAQTQPIAMDAVEPTAITNVEPTISAAPSQSIQPIMAKPIEVQPVIYGQGEVTTSEGINVQSNDSETMQQNDTQTNESGDNETNMSITTVNDGQDEQIQVQMLPMNESEGTNVNDINNETQEQIQNQTNDNETIEVDANESEVIQSDQISQNQTEQVAQSQINDTSTQTNEEEEEEEETVNIGEVVTLPTTFVSGPQPTTYLPNPNKGLTQQGQQCLDKCREKGGISCKKWEGNQITCCIFTGCQWPFYCNPSSRIQVQGCTNMP